MTNAQSPNDCVNAITICGNQDINLDVSGSGVQEININNACNSNENNSLWLRIPIEVGGTLGFTLTPQSSSIHEDYDFWVFGPDVSCGNLGTAIRCSTTNPNAAHQGNNLTGMNGSSNETSEGPGPNGDSFVRWLDVNAGETYYIVLDRPHGNSAFNLTWTGSAIITNPFNELAEPFGEFPLIELCDGDENGIESFDFSSLDSDYLSGTSGFGLTYYQNEGNAITSSNPLTGAVNVQSGIYYARIEHDETECFEIREVEIEVDGVNIQPVSIALCDSDENDQENFDLSSIDFQISPVANYNFQFYNSQLDAENLQNPINPSVLVQNTTETFYVSATTTEHDCIGVGEIELEIYQPITVQSYSDALCDDDYDGKLNVGLTDYVSSLVISDNYTSYEFYPTYDDAENQTSPLGNSYTFDTMESVFVRFSNPGCYAIAELSITVNPKPNLGDDELIKFCPEQAPLELRVDSGYSEYSWSHDENESGNSVWVSEPGSYSVQVINEFGCIYEKTFTLDYYVFPYIQFIHEINRDIEIDAWGETTPIYFSMDDGFTWQEFNRFNNLEPGLYEILVKYEEGCVSDPFVFVILEIPNTITPNGDGINDYWNIAHLETLEGSHMTIYDRYGKVVYDKAIDAPFSWDGFFAGRPLPSTTYWFTLRLELQQSRQGWIMIKNRDSAK